MARFQKPQLANAFKDTSFEGVEAELIKRGSSNLWFMEPKLDGWRCLAYVGREINLYTRSGQDITDRVPHIVDDLRNMQKDLGGKSFVFDGELGYTYQNPDMTWPIIQFTKTQSVLGSGADVSLAKQAMHRKEAKEYESWDIEYHVFDVLGAFVNRAQTVRQRVLSNIFDRYWDTDVPKYVQQVCSEAIGCHKGFAGLDYVQKAYTRYVSQGGEGLIFKNAGATYIHDGRPASHWLKLKAYDTIDAVILGYEPGQGKYAGQVGALIFGFCTGEQPEWSLAEKALYRQAGKCSGMDDTTRRHMTDHFMDEYIMKVVEVGYFGLIGDGNFRHPNFVRMRSDKFPWECLDPRTH